MTKQNSLVIMVLLAAVVTVSTANAGPPRAPLAQNGTRPVTVTISYVRAGCDPEVSGQDFYAKVKIGDADWVNFDDEAGDDDNEIYPSWTAIQTVDANETALPIHIEMWDQDGGWPFNIDPDDRVDIHPDADKNRLDVTFDVTSGEWTVDMGVPGPDNDPPFGHRSVWTGSNGDDCAQVEFDISTAPNGDTDGDGLLDNWELSGLDLNGDGFVDVDLPAMGARPDHKDIFVEADWMQQPAGANPHSHEPWQAAWIPVWKAFNAAPVSNVDGTQGIELHVDTGSLYSNLGVGDCDPDGDGVPAPGDMDCDGDGIIDIGNLGALGAGTAGGGNALTEVEFLSSDGNGAANDFYTIKRDNFNPVRARVFHYAIFAHNLGDAPGTLGLGQVFGGHLQLGLALFGNGNVSPSTGLPVQGPPLQQAGIFMHELGHNLNLRHGGGDTRNFKPNYISVMNNDHVTGIAGLDSGILDYSPTNLARLDENDLDECVYLGDPRPNAIAWWTKDDGNTLKGALAFGTNTMNWNGDGDGNYSPGDDGATCPVGEGNDGNFAQDLNYRDTNAIQRDVLESFNDWQNLRLDFMHRDGWAESVWGEFVPEITFGEYQAIKAAQPRVVPLTSPNQFCPGAARINFDNLPVGTVVTHQYAALGVHIVDNAWVDPVIRAGERGAATQSPPNSLYGRTQPPEASFGLPLTITFDKPQYRVGLFMGNGELFQATLRAYDGNGQLIGEVKGRVPEPVTGFLGLYAIAGGVRAVELIYPTSNAEEIDDLIFDGCASIPPDPVVPTDPHRTTVRAESRELIPMGENSEVVVTELDGVAVEVNGVVRLTTYEGEIARGEAVNLVAPAEVAGPGGQVLAFAYWRQDEFLRFPEGRRTLVAVPERDTSYTAVYRRLPCYDLDTDGTVGASDIMALAGYWGQAAGRPYDADGDGTITVVDIMEVAAAWGTPCSTVIVPTLVADTYVFSAAPATNYGTATTLYAGSQSTSATGRALFRFDLSAIPAGATVLNASFQANLVQSSSSPATLDVELKRVDAPWQEMVVTWNTQPGYTGANNVTGVGKTMGYYSWDVASLVQTWVNGASNYGLTLISKNETTIGWRGFASRESTAPPPNPPRLVVTYQP